VDQPVMDQQGVDEPIANEPPAGGRTAEEKRITLWHTAWGVVLAASSAFTLGYAMSRAADPSVGASRPPAWPLFISFLVIAVSLWFVLAPRLHQWPFETRPNEARPVEEHDAPEPWLAELTDAEIDDAN
jgi:hypothetical protein